MSNIPSSCHASARLLLRRILPRPVIPATLGVTWGLMLGCGGSPGGSPGSTPGPAPSVVVVPALVTLDTGAGQSFSAQVTGLSPATVAWSVAEGAAGGTVAADGRYTAPGTAGVFTVKASSTADASRFGTATVTVRQPGTGGTCGGMALGAGASLQGYRPFPDDNPWNQDISSAPVDPGSDAIIAFIGATTGLHPDFGANWSGGPFGIPYQVVDDAQAKVRITFTAYGGESDPGPMPVPAGAPIEGGAGSTGDRHVLVLDRGSCILYELYRAFPQGDGSWSADSASVWDLQSNALRPWGWTSADAAGLPIFPGLARYDEVAAGEIRHALRFTVPTSRRAYVPPASHWASSNTSTSAPPMGMRVRLKASVDLSGLSPQARVVAAALKRYGMILADNGSAWYISGAPDARWSDGDLRTLGNLKGSDFEVIRMDGLVTANPTGVAPTIASFMATPATVSAGGASTLSWSATGATRAFVSPEPGMVRGTAATVRPASTTTYTLTVQGPFGATTRTITVTVAP